MSKHTGTCFSLLDDSCAITKPLPGAYQGSGMGVKIGSKRLAPLSDRRDRTGERQLIESSMPSLKTSSATKAAPVPPAKAPAPPSEKMEAK